jgi:hypothetical protein
MRNKLWMILVDFGWPPILNLPAGISSLFQGAFWCLTTILLRKQCRFHIYQWICHFNWWNLLMGQSLPWPVSRYVGLDGSRNFVDILRMPACQTSWHPRGFKWISCYMFPASMCLTYCCIIYYNTLPSFVN